MKNVLKFKFLMIFTLIFLFILLPGTNVFAAGKPSLNEKSVKIFIGKTFDFNVKNSAKGATSQWTTSDNKIASVNKSGLVKGITKGTVKITCNVKSSGKTYHLTATVIVIEPAKDAIPDEVEDADTMQITNQDLDSNNSVVFADKNFTNVYISNSVKNASIKFDHCSISGTLTMETGAAYKVETTNTTIQTSKFINPEYITTAVKDEKRPTLYISDTSVIKDVLLGASCCLEQSNAAQVDKLEVVPKIKGDHEMLITGYHGDIDANYDTFAQTRVELAGCTIGTVNIKKVNGDYFDLTSNADQLSSIDTVNLKSQIMTALDVPINVLNIDKSLSEAKLIVGSPIKKLVHYGSTISFQVCEDAFITEVEDKLSADHSYGTYIFNNWDYGDFAFTLKVNERLIEGILLKDFEKIFQVWTDTTKPFEVPEEKGVVMSCIDKDTYQFDFNGSKVKMGIFFDKGVVKVFGGEGIVISNISLPKKKP